MRHQHIYVLSLAVFGAACAYSQIITLNPVPSRAIGAPGLTVTNLNPNLVEGREFYFPQAVALDKSVSPPILYVSDYGNNRVLAWKNAASFKNGQKADLVIGQPDFVTTALQGPGRQFPSGLTLPSGLAVDGGDLYVADSGNNRVVRYRTPFAQTTQFPFPDLAIGQLNTSSGRNPNYPTNSVNAQGLALNGAVAGLAFDSSRNLWVIDGGNTRILRFNVNDLQSGISGGLTADRVLGQADFISNTALSSSDTASLYKLDKFIAPSALAFDPFDPNGNLFVGDSGRALVFVGPDFSNGMKASTHILGQDANNPNPAQAFIDQTAIYGPSAFFFLSGGASGVGVVDGAASRIMIFDTFANWPSTRPVAKSIIGQLNLCPRYYPNGACLYPNNGNPTSSSGSLWGPGGVAYTGTELFLADTGNHRVLDFPQQGTGAPFGDATRVLGQDDFTVNSPNLIEGREFQFTGSIPGISGTFADAAITIDNRTGTPHLYVSDPYNNRVLGFNDLRKFQNGGVNKADIVLGQQAAPATALVNYPSGDSNKPTKSSLHRPVGLLVDAQGNLYVADSLNGRVLRFPAPFAYAGLETPGTTPGPTPEPADLVLGQQTFTSNTNNGPTSTTMALPYGLAFSPSCVSATQQCAAPNGLLVSDQFWNRVLYIPTTGGSFVAGGDNGKAATIVFGQANFNTTGLGSSQSQMNNPHLISCDTRGNVYVADTGNNRVIIFADPNAASTLIGSPNVGSISTGLSGPQSVYVSPNTGEIWVANTGSGTSSRYSAFVLNGLSSLIALPDYSDPTNTSSALIAPVAVVQDQYGDLFVADQAHRVTIYYPGLNVCNGASFFPVSPTSAQNPTANCLTQYDPGLKTAQSKGIRQRQLAPGTFATIFPCVNCQPNQFGDQTGVFNNTYPVPKLLSDVQVLVDGTPAILYYVGPPILPDHPTGQINFVMPNKPQTAQSASVEVVQVSTGQVLGAAVVPMNSAAPAFFLHPDGQTGATAYAAVINQDGTVNSASNPAQRGQFVSLYMTGEGYVPGAPPDGVPPATAIASQFKPTVLINNLDVNSQYGESGEHVLYYGLNTYPGMWQINVKIPAGVVPPASIDVIVNNISAWDLTLDSPYHTYIYVK